MRDRGRRHEHNTTMFLSEQLKTNWAFQVATVVGIFKAFLLALASGRVNMAIQ